MPDYNNTMRNSILTNIANNIGGGTNTLEVLNAADQVLATHNNIPAFPAAVNGTTSLTTISDAVMTGNGIATKVRVTKAGNVNVFTVAAGEVTFDDNNYVVGNTSRVVSLTLNYPSGNL